MSRKKQPVKLYKGKPTQTGLVRQVLQKKPEATVEEVMDILRKARTPVSRAVAEKVCRYGTSSSRKDHFAQGGNITLAMMFKAKAFAVSMGGISPALRILRILKNFAE